MNECNKSPLFTKCNDSTSSSIRILCGGLPTQADVLAQDNSGMNPPTASRRHPSTPIDPCHHRSQVSIVVNDRNIARLSHHVLETRTLVRSMMQPDFRHTRRRGKDETEDRVRAETKKIGTTTTRRNDGS